MEACPIKAGGYGKLFRARDAARKRGGYATRRLAYLQNTTYIWRSNKGV